MSEEEVQRQSEQLLTKMVGAKQLSAMDAKYLARQGGGGIHGEEQVLRWLGGEYGLGFTNLEDIELDRQLLSLFPARILLCDWIRPPVSPPSYLTSATVAPIRRTSRASPSPPAWSQI